MPKELTDEEIHVFRERLCESFKRLFAEKGYAAVTMRAMAEDIGCSPMTPYRYFKDKDEIFAAARAAGFRKLSKLITDATKGINEVVEKTRLASVTYINFALREPELYRLMYTSLQPDTTAYPELEEEVARARQVLTNLAEEVPQVRDSLMRPAAVAQTFWAALHGIIQIHLTNGFDDSTSFDEIVAILMSLLTAGGRALFHLPMPDEEST